VENIKLKDILECGQEILWDAKEGIPFPDESVEEIRTSHFLEHLDNEQVPEFLYECMRVLKHKGKMINILPHASTPGAYFLGHKTFWTEYGVEALLRLEKFIRRGFECPFVITENIVDGANLKFTLTKII